MVEPNGLALDPAQNRLFIADVADHRVRVVDLASGIIWTFAGTGEAKHSGDGGPAAEAGIHGARAVKVAAGRRRLYLLERQEAHCGEWTAHRDHHNSGGQRRQGLCRRRRPGSGRGV